MRPLALGTACLMALTLWAQDKGIENLAPYTATPEMVVDRMLKLGDLKPGEKMFDLGSGDGRIVIMAARKYASDSTGVEFDDLLFKQSMKQIQKLGLSSMARIIHGDLLQQDYASADLITVYLLPIASIKLTPILDQQLKKGARIVSHNADFPKWTPEKVEIIDNDGAGHSHRLYLYRH
jgi:protein-L-isoaspartate O-methyltransferase